MPRFPLAANCWASREGMHATLVPLAGGREPWVLPEKRHSRHMIGSPGPAIRVFTADAEAPVQEILPLVPLATT